MGSSILCGFPSKSGLFILKLKEMWGDSLIFLKNIETVIEVLLIIILPYFIRIYKNKCSSKCYSLKVPKTFSTLATLY